MAGALENAGERFAKGAMAAGAGSSAAPVALAVGLSRVSNTRIAKLMIGLNDEDFRRFRRVRKTSIVLLFVGLALTGIAIGILAQLKPEPVVAVLTIVGVSFIAIFGPLIYWSIAAKQPLSIHRHDGEFAWLSGAGDEFLKSLPDFTTSIIATTSANNSPIDGRVAADTNVTYTVLRLPASRKRRGRQCMHATCNRSGAPILLTGDNLQLAATTWSKFSGITCPNCKQSVRLNELTWADSGETLKEYRLKVRRAVGWRKAWPYRLASVLLAVPLAGLAVGLFAFIAWDDNFLRFLVLAIWTALSFYFGKKFCLPVIIRLFGIRLVDID